MPLQLRPLPQSIPPEPPRPLLYLITNGETTIQTTPATEDFQTILKLIQAAVDARVDLVQIREKNLSAKVLCELVTAAVRLTRGSSTRLLVNDRADIAVAVGAEGVHLTTSSLPVEVVRRAFGGEFLIGVSTHSLAEARAAREGGADFVVYGPVFETTSKKKYGEALGLVSLAGICAELAPFPVFALGGVTPDKVTDCVRAGAAGVAAIGMFDDADRLAEVVTTIRAKLRSF
jgi:thiamine-phosphate pyrophosphorylase